MYIFFYRYITTERQVVCISTIQIGECTLQKMTIACLEHIFLCVHVYFYVSGFRVRVRKSVELGSGTCSEPGSGFRVWSGNRGSGAREARSQATVTAPKP